MSQGMPGNTAEGRALSPGRHRTQVPQVHMRPSAAAADTALLTGPPPRRCIWQAAQVPHVHGPASALPREVLLT